jgi:hypothetical protein
MKIRCKTDHKEVREVSLAPSTYLSKWVSSGPWIGEQRLYDEKHWEPVPEERWETVSITVSERVLKINTSPLWEYHLPEGYRFREVSFGGFIIERKIS